MNRPWCVGIATLISAAPLTAQQTRDLTPYLMDRVAEVALARTAAPKSISDSAAVLVLTRTGFTEASHGTNGFTCLVLRSFSAGADDPNLWNPRVRAPHCFNPPGVRTVLPASLKQVEWILGGASPKDVAARIRRAYASHEFPAPAPGAMAYMLSQEQYLVDDDPHWMPHLMFFYDRSLPASAWGAGGFDAPVINGSAGDPQSPVLTLFVPVRQWANGSSAMHGTDR